MRVFPFRRQFDVQHTRGVLKDVRHRLLAHHAALLDVARPIQDLLSVLENVLATEFGARHGPIATLHAALRVSAFVGVTTARQCAAAVAIVGGGGGSGQTQFARLFVHNLFDAETLQVLVEGTLTRCGSDLGESSIWDKSGR